ncbi:uncharacterized protein LOC122277050 [Carya illinoinensis]|uniref:uncharacterized protein LOC122277050 n=1 Tax=Carya illinoinensis TaxID=32201 RepID=UPI001C7289EC|nr:uncharacterized protein LOC122277050 [Carya illinoinensis]
MVSETSASFDFHLLVTVAAHYHLTVTSSRHEPGIDTSYTAWIFHGEEKLLPEFSTDSEEEVPHAYNYNDYIDDVDEMLDDIRVGSFKDNSYGTELNLDEGPSQHTAHDLLHTTFEELLENARKPLYPNCTNFSQLSFIVKLLHIKTVGGWTVKSFDMVIKLLQAAFPHALFPASFHEARRLQQGLGFGYKKIHVCPNDCALFWKEHADKDECPKCNASRWASIPHLQQRIPQKVLRYFPLKPRLQRLFISKKTAQSMRWHVEERVDDPNLMRHPADSSVWKDFDNKHAGFAQDPRNVRLGLASDGFNPFNNLSKPYSIWPVLLVPYNLPPWLCMKDPYVMMSLLIRGPKAPRNDIDVFLRPLIDELTDLWVEGIHTYDAYKRESFQLRAALLWTINDFPAYANLSGWSTKGKLACPSCNTETDSLWLVHGRKHCYMTHRRWLAQDHSWRRKKSAFNGKEEHRLQLRMVEGQALMEQLHEVSNVQFGKSTRKRKRKPNELNWTKKRIFFELPYWLDLGLRHNLDVMHIEKNICENVMGTLMNIEGKSKDTAAARMDLEDLGLRKELHLRHDGTQTSMSLACYMLNVNERRSFCARLAEVKFPDGFASNIARCVNITDGKIMGMKSHDCHIFMQYLLPVVIGGYLRPDVRRCLIELCLFFKELCSRTLDITMLKRLQANIPIILCKLEMIFPPAFFDIMVHLAIHLPDEALLAGPVQYRWMYPFERYMGKFKRYVHNRARPEGSIAEAYLHVECLTFCSMYLNDIETRHNREERNTDTVGPSSKNLNISVFIQKIAELHSMTPPAVSDDIFALSCGPDPRVASYSRCIMNGIRFHTKQLEGRRRTQNSGVVVHGEHQGLPVDFYDVLQDIIELRYMGWRKCFIFKCDWWDIGDTRRGIHVGEHFTSVNTNRQWYKDEPFALACQTLQVFYIKDPNWGGSWHAVHKITNRNVYNIRHNTSDLHDDANDDDDESDTVDSEDESDTEEREYGLVNETSPESLNPLTQGDEDQLPVDPSTRSPKELSRELNDADDCLIYSICRQRVRFVKEGKAKTPSWKIDETVGEKAPNMIEFYKETHWSSKKEKFINAASEYNYNMMLERLNEKETEEDIQEAAGDVFKEVMGFKSGYAQGLGHSVIPEPSPFMKKNKAFKRIAEENERNKESADLYKSKLEALLGDMAELRKQFSEHDKQIMVMSSQLGTSRESQQETQGDA